MSEDSGRRGAGRGGGRGWAAAALLTAVALLLGPAAATGAVSAGGASEAQTLRWGIERTAELARQRLVPPARRLARGLPADADRLQRLLEPASAAQTQIGVALDQLEQMSALAYDPHYLPALVAVGRAFTATSGRDPLTGTPINPEYSGLGPEIAVEAQHLQRSGGEAGELSRDVARLSRRLRAAKRRARRLEWKLRRTRLPAPRAAGRR